MSQPRMAAKLDSSDPSSPLAYKPSETAILLLDFQNLTVNMLADDGKAALTKAKTMRDWALSKNMLVMHSIVDLDATPRQNAKGRERYPIYMEMAKKNPDAAKEPADIAANPDNENEVVVYKQLGFVSGLKSKGAMETLSQHGIKSLVICGLSTSGAALRTSLAAADEGFVVTVIEDACADRVDGLHEMLVKHAMPMTAHVAGAEEFVRAYDEGRKEV